MSISVLEVSAYTGDLSNLPEKEKSVVRIFLSSTFTDSSEERNALFQECIPKVREYCRSKQLDFQVADMRWGIRSEALLEHRTTDLCLREVEKCKQLSLGPCFFCFLGEKYGYRYYPNEIISTEFEILLQESQALHLDIYLLEKWYRQDENMVPPYHVLFPITAIYPNYSLFENDKLRKEDEKKWQQDSAMLEKILRQAAQSALAKNLLTEEQAESYIISVTEKEICHAFKSLPNPNDSCLCFIRQFDEIYLKDKVASRFIDMIDNEVNKESVELLQKLKNVKMDQYLALDRIIRFESVQWCDVGINKDMLPHEHYLQKFCREFDRLITLQIDKACSLRQSGIHLPDLFTECLHHLHLCKNKIVSFAGRDDVLKEVQHLTSVSHDFVSKEGDDEDISNPLEEQLKAEAETQMNNGVKFSSEGAEYNESDYQHLTSIPRLKNTKRNHPIFVHGFSGSGKTAFASVVAHNAASWFSDPVLVIRYCGTSSQSSTIRSVLLSLALQISAVYNCLEETQQVIAANNEDYEFLKKLFISLLYRVDTSAKPLVLILDSIDQLESTDAAYSFDWLPYELPVTVHLLVTFMSENTVCLQSSQNRFPADCFVKISTLTNQDSSAILNHYLTLANRRLTADQFKSIQIKANENQGALYLKILFDESLLWRSFHYINLDSLPNSVEQAVRAIFERLETKHGHMLVSRAFGYLSLSRSGLTETELEDILSLDDEVLQDTYLHQLPPSPTLIRLPPLLWKRLRDDVDEYLIERQAFGGRVLAWYHRQFVEICSQRYCSDIEINMKLHKLMSEYFLGSWHGKPKPLELFLRKKGSYPKCERGVPSQQLRLTQFLFNLRQIDELPHHLINSKQYDVFMTHCVQSLDWLMAHVNTLGLVSLQTVLALFLSQSDLTKQQRVATEDVQTTLAMVSDIIATRPEALPAQIIGQWVGVIALPKHAKKLYLRAQEMVQKELGTQLIPTSHCVPKPGGDIIAKREIIVGYLGNVFNSRPISKMGSDQLLVNNFCRTNNPSKPKAKLEILNSNFHSVESLEVPFDVFCVKEINSLLPNLVILTLFTSDRSDKYNWTISDILFDMTSRTCLVGHSDLKNTSHCLCFTSSGKSILSLSYKRGNKQKTSSDGTDTESTFNLLEIPSLQTKVVYKMDKGSELIRYAVISNCGRYIAAKTKDHQFFVWSIENSEVKYVVNSFNGKADAEICQSFDSMRPGDGFLLAGPHGIVTSVFCSLGYNKTDLVYIDLDKGVATCLLGHTGAYKMKYLTVSESGLFMLASVEDECIVNGNRVKDTLIYEIENFKMVSKVEGRDSVSLQVFVEEDKGLIGVAWRDHCHLSLFTYLSGKLEDPYYPTAVKLMNLVGHENFIVYCFCFNDYLVTGAEDNTCCVWNKTDIVSKALKNKPKLETQKDKEMDSTALNAKDPTSKVGFEVDSELMTTVALFISTKYKYLICVRSSGWILVHDTKERNLMKGVCRKIEGFGIITKAAMSDEWLCVLDSSGNVHCFFIKKMEEIHVFKPSKNQLRSICLVDNILAVGVPGMEGVGYVYDLNAGTHLAACSGLYSFNEIILTPDAKFCITTFFDFPLVFNVSDSQPISDMDGVETMMGSCSGLALNREGSLLASASMDGSLRVLRLSTMTYERRFQQRSSCRALCFFKQFLVSAGFRRLLFWSLTSGELERTISRHRNFVNRIEVTKDDSFMITCGEDRAVLVWDTKTWLLLGCFDSQYPVRCLAFNTDLSILAIDCGRLANYATLKLHKDGVSQSPLAAFADITGALNPNSQSATCSLM